MTPQIRVSSLTKSFGSNTVVDGLDLEIEQGEFLVLLGPSGCGKTTTLRCLAGLETPSSGSIELGQRTVFDSTRKVDVSPNHRSLGMVFQSYALWPHMTVKNNIRYPLKVRRMKRALAEDWAGDIARMVDCGDLLDRYPSQLSGGQQQRVALARGLVARPDLVLFDEPLSNLDARLRDQVRTEIHQLHSRLGFTAVFVTHDQSEALALGDRLAVMRSGRIEQFDSPREIFERPTSEYVAEFIGMGNRIELVRGHHGWETPSGELVDVGKSTILGDRAVARVRADDITIHRDVTTVPDGDIGLTASFQSAEYGGRHFDVALEYSDRPLQLTMPVRANAEWLGSLVPGEKVIASFSTDHARFFTDDGATGASSASAVPVLNEV